MVEYFDEITFSVLISVLTYNKKHVLILFFEKCNFLQYIFQL